MDKKQEKIVLEVEVDEECYSVIQEYSDFIDDTETNVLNRLVNYTLREYAVKYDNLKQGYKNMGKINLEISRAFTESENEAFNRIDD